MDKNNKFVITINRELGSGGRTVGRIVAERLGVPFYDKAVIQELTKKFGMSVEDIEKMKGKSHSWWQSFKSSLFSVNPDIYTDENDDMDMDSDSDSDSDSGQVPFNPTSAELFHAETKVLKKIAEEGSCVIAGRSAFYVFREDPNHINVFIQASMPFRIARVMRTQNMTEDEAKKTIERIDTMRENYLKEFTGATRYDTRNYNLVISADEMNEEEIADIIMTYFEKFK